MHPTHITHFPRTARTRCAAAPADSRNPKHAHAHARHVPAQDIRYVEEVKRLEQREKDIRGRAGGHHGSAGAAAGSVTTSTVSSTGFWRPAVKPLGSKDQI